MSFLRSEIVIAVVAAAAGCGGDGSSSSDLPAGGAEVDGTVAGMTFDDVQAAFYYREATPNSGLVLIGPQFGTCGNTDTPAYHVVVGLSCALSSGATFGVQPFGQACPTAWLLVEEGARDVATGQSGDVTIETFGDTVTGSFSAMVSGTDEQLSPLEGHFNAIRCIDSGPSN